MSPETHRPRHRRRTPVPCARPREPAPGEAGHHPHHRDRLRRWRTVEPQAWIRRRRAA